MMQGTNQPMTDSSNKSRMMELGRRMAENEKIEPIGIDALPKPPPTTFVTDGRLMPLQPIQHFPCVLHSIPDKQ